MARVALGVPVFDGERYLEKALVSLVEQTYGDFEVWILDNASRDRTAEIARDAAADDKRFHYVRNAQNIGAAPNFNRALACSKGELFKWAAHDDICAPTFLERCVEALDRNPTALLAHPQTRIIDERGDTVEDYDVKLATDQPSAKDRFNALLWGHKCFEVFGLFRRETLVECGGIGCYAHGDGVLLSKLALRGPFVEIPEPLFLARRHETQSMTMVGDYDAYAQWFDARLRGRRLFPSWRIHWEWAKAIWGAPVDLETRLRCSYWLARATAGRRAQLWHDVTGQLRRAPANLSASA